MELFDGVRLVKDPSAQNDVVQDSSSARSAGDDETTGLDTLVIDRVVNFFKSRSLQFKLLDNESRQMADGNLELIYSVHYDPFAAPPNS